MVKLKRSFETGAEPDTAITNLNELAAFSAKQVADRLSMHVNTIRTAMRKGRIEGAVRFGSDWRLPAVKFAKLIEKGF